MILAQRILDCLRSNGPIAPGELANWFRDTDRIDFDAAVTRLMRQNSISLTLGKYDLVAQKTANGHKPFIATPIAEPPTAAEAAASATRAAPITRERFECPACHNPRFDAEFRHSSLGKRFNICKYCETAKTQRTREKRYETNMAGGRATVTAEDSLSITGESSGPDRLPPPHTPPQPQPGSTEPPAISSEHPSGHLAQGTLTTSFSPGDPEALSPVGAGRTIATASTPAVELTGLAHKRAWLVQKREQLRLEYEASAKGLDDRIEEIDRVTAQVKKLLEAA